MYGKRGYGRGQWGVTLRYNFIDASTYGTAGCGAIFDFAGGTETSVVAGSKLLIHNNVVVGSSPIKLFSTNGYQQRLQSELLEIYNNTIVIDTKVSIACTGAAFQAHNPGAKYYNNVLCGISNDDVVNSTLEFGMTLINDGPHQVLDYNSYPVRAHKWSRFANGGTPYDGSLRGGLNLAAWRSSLAAVPGQPATAQELNSAQMDPVFVGQGPFAQQYKLQPGSPLKTFGRVGGTSAGAVIEAGAWGGTTRIGHDFGLVPRSPGLQSIS